MHLGQLQEQNIITIHRHVFLPALVSAWSRQRNNPSYALNLFPSGRHGYIPSRNWFHESKKLGALLTQARSGIITSHCEMRLASAASQAARQLAASRKARTGGSPGASEGTGARSSGSGGRSARRWPPRSSPPPSRRRSRRRAGQRPSREGEGGCRRRRWRRPGAW